MRWDLWGEKQLPAGAITITWAVLHYMALTNCCKGFRAYRGTKEKNLQLFLLQSKERSYHWDSEVFWSSLFECFPNSTSKRVRASESGNQIVGPPSHGLMLEEKAGASESHSEKQLLTEIEETTLPEEPGEQTAASFSSVSITGHCSSSRTHCTILLEWV